MRQIGFAVALLFFSACDAKAPESSEAKSAPSDQESIEKSTDLGPIKATVSLTPKEPKLGDVIRLTLHVEADSGVDVELPSFGEALGRFSIVDFTPREEHTADGRFVAEQVYRLQPPMSGKQRIPALRVEFVDRREAGASDAGVEEVKELLTEELPLTVASVLPEGSDDTLRGARGKLPLHIGTSGWIRYGGLIAVLLLVLAFLMLWPRIARYSKKKAQISAFDVAMKRLRSLEDRGLPEPEAADEWYVELSNIVRRYLEDRYGLRAPELTTEEFLRVAGRSSEIAEGHQQLLSSFLEGCDRVKFAAHKPEATESSEALRLARTFLEETRLVEAPTGEPAEVGA